MKAFVTCVLLQVFICFVSLAQYDKRDSLLAVLAGNPGKEKAETLVALSRWFLTAGFKQAIAYADEAVALTQAVGPTRQLAMALTNLAMLRWYNGEYASSIDLNQQSIQIRESSGDTEGIAENRFNIAMNYYYSSDYQQSLAYHEQALAGYRQTSNRRMEAEVLHRIALVYHLMGNYPDAIRYLHEFWIVRQEFTGFQGRTYNMGETSLFFRSREYFERELELQLAALEELKTKENVDNILLTYLNIADTYKELRIYDRALAFHKEAAVFATSIGQVPQLNSLGNAYRAVGQLDSAIQVHRQALILNSERGNQLDYMYGQRLLGEDLYRIGRVQEAFDYYSEGLRITERMGNKLDVVVHKQKMAAILASVGRFEEAHELSAQAVELAARIKAKSFLREGYHQLAELSSKLGDFEAAFKYESKHRQLADSLISGEADLQLAQMQAQFELDRKNENINRLIQEREIQQGKIRNRELLIYGSVSLLLLGILLAISIFLRFRQKNKDNRILQAHMAQIELLLAEVHHRVKNNLQVISSLLSIQSDQLRSKNAREAVLEGQSRVQAMGLIHESIYQAGNFAFVQMEDYMRKICSALIDTFGLANTEISLQVRGNNLAVDVDTAIPLGLIINELVTNSLKHAFESVNDPAIVLTLAVSEDNLLTLEVKDNGRGFLTPSRQNSFGLKLVSELTRQLGGTIDFAQRHGLSVTLKLSRYKVAA